jgi:hypothetical protein
VVWREGGDFNDDNDHSAQDLAKKTMTILFTSLLPYATKGYCIVCGEKQKTQTNRVVV